MDRVFAENVPVSQRFPAGLESSTVEARCAYVEVGGEVVREGGHIYVVFSRSRRLRSENAHIATCAPARKTVTSVVAFHLRRQSSWVQGLSLCVW